MNSNEEVSQQKSASKLFYFLPEKSEKGKWKETRRIENGKVENLILFPQSLTLFYHE